MDKSFLDKLKQRTTSLKSEYQTFESHHRELSEYVLPRLGRWLLSDTNLGGKKNGKIYDNTGKLAIGVLVAGLMSGLTSPSRPWFNLIHPDPDKQERQAVKIWADTVRRRMMAVYASSNVYNSLARGYFELSLFGQGPIGLFEDRDEVIHTQDFTAGEYFIANNEKGYVNTFARHYRLSVSQVIGNFGLDNVSTLVRSAYDNGNYDKWIDLWHLIEPNVGRDTSKIDSSNKKFRSVYWEDSVQDKVLSFKGFDEFPIFCPRWELNNGDIYASSCPAMDALGDIKELQLHEKRSLEAVEKMVRPSMVADPSLRNRKKSQVPGGITYSSFVAGKPGFKPAFEVNPRIQELEAKSEQIRDRIRKAFYSDLFLMMTNIDRRQITAREIAERHEEKLLMLGPVLERLNKELLDPLIERTFNIMWRRGLIPPPPPEIEGENLKIEYVSILHQAQRSVGVSGIDRFLNTSAAIVQLNPSSAHKVNYDQIIDEYGSMLGIPPALVRSDEEAEKLRASEQAALQYQANVDNGEKMTKMAKDLSETKSDENSALNTVISQLQQQQQQ